MHASQVFCFVACSVIANTVFAWGADGHQAVGALADNYIAGTNADKEVKKLLNKVSPGLTLKGAAVWADCAKGVIKTNNGTFRYVANPRYTECQPFETTAGKRRMADYVSRNWDSCPVGPKDEVCHKQYHYADVAIEHDAYQLGLVGTSNHDVVGAINAAIVVLQGGTAPSPFNIKDKTEALLLLSHFVGDIHQPLHVAAVYLNQGGHAVDPDKGTYDPDSKTDGGNDIMDSSKKLHGEWDSIPDNLDASHLEQGRLDAMRAVPATPGALSSWSTTWATDTVLAAKPAFQGLNYSSEDVQHHRWSVALATGYAKTRTDIQRDQLIKAGARLGQILEAVWP